MLNIEDVKVGDIAVLDWAGIKAHRLTHEEEGHVCAHCDLKSYHKPRLSVDESEGLATVSEEGEHTDFAISFMTTEQALQYIRDNPTKYPQGEE